MAGRRRIRLSSRSWTRGRRCRRSVSRLSYCRQPRRPVHSTRRLSSWATARPATLAAGGGVTAGHMAAGAAEDAGEDVVHEVVARRAALVSQLDKPVTHQ